MSWDVNDDLWAAQGDQIVMFRGTANTRQPLGQMVPVDVFDPARPGTGPFTALQVAPDGVRVAIVMRGNELTFGAISGQQRAEPADHALPGAASPLPTPPSSPG